jgi:hypothetical protein
MRLQAAALKGKRVAGAERRVGVEQALIRALQMEINDR